MTLDHPSRPGNHQSPGAIIYQERIRQARWGFNVALGLTAASSVITLAGILLLFAGQLSQGGLTSVGGLASNLVSVRCLQLAKDANDRLDKATQDLNND